jgi:23S rRNA G2445 N2-methylase RlmL
MLNENEVTYVTTCLYGLERTLAEEIQERLGTEPERRWCQVSFPFAGDPGRLPELRVAHNIFMQFAECTIGHTQADLQELRPVLEALPLADWQERLARVDGGEPESEEISVSVSRQGEHNYTYQDVEDLALEVLQQDRGRRATLDPRPLELRLEINDEQCRLLGRLTTESLANRPWRVRYWNGETEATLAAAMARIAGLERQDRFLDPFCGSGTVAIERALSAPCGPIVAGDSKPKRLEWAEANVDAAGVDVELACWDAAELPFDDMTFDVLCTVPPHSDPADGRPWVAERFSVLVAECMRVLRYGARSVWLLRDERPMDWTLKHGVAMSRRARIQASWKGTPCYIHVIEKDF